MSGTVSYSILEGTEYIGAKNNTKISDYNAHVNSYFNINMQQSAYFTMLIDGFEYDRFYSSFSSTTTSSNDGYISSFDSNLTTKGDGSIYWMPLKSLNYTQGAIEMASIPVGVFADLQLPFRKHLPTLSVEMYDHRSDFFEMKLREWHNMSCLTEGFVPVLESICKKVQIRSWATNGECNSLTQCQCIIADDITVTRTYDANDLKTIQFKLVVVGWGGDTGI